MILKPSPCSSSDIAAAAAKASRTVRANACEDAELVAADAVDLALTRHGCAQLLRNPREERVAGRMAEGVVVGLEPVEIEKHQDGRRAGIE